MPIAACGVAFLIEYERRGLTELDDRPPTSGELIITEEGVLLMDPEAKIEPTDPPIQVGAGGDLIVPREDYTDDTELGDELDPTQSRKKIRKPARRVLRSR